MWDSERVGLEDRVLNKCVSVMLVSNSGFWVLGIAIKGKSGWVLGFVLLRQNNECPFCELAQSNFSNANTIVSLVVLACPLLLVFA